jgi:hypothetical protein
LIMQVIHQILNKINPPRIRRETSKNDHRRQTKPQRYRKEWGKNL